MQLKFVGAVFTIGRRRGAIQVAIVGIETIIVIAFLLQCVVGVGHRRGAQQLDAVVFAIAVLAEEIIARKTFIWLGLLPCQFRFVATSQLKIEVARWIAGARRGTRFIGIFATLAAFAKHRHSIAMAALRNRLIQKEPE